MTSRSIFWQIYIKQRPNFEILNTFYKKKFPPKNTFDKHGHKYLCTLAKQFSYVAFLCNQQQCQIHLQPIVAIHMFSRGISGTIRSGNLQSISGSFAFGQCCTVDCKNPSFQEIIEDNLVEKFDLICSVTSPKFVNVLMVLYFFTFAALKAFSSLDPARFLKVNHERVIIMIDLSIWGLTLTGRKLFFKSY